MTTPQQPRTPTTEAGRWLSSRIVSVFGEPELADRFVADVEDAQRADLLAQIEKAVLAIRGSSVQDAYMLGAEDMRAAVLAAIRSAAPVET